MEHLPSSLCQLYLLKKIENAGRGGGLANFMGLIQANSSYRPNVYQPMITDSLTV